MARRVIARAVVELTVSDDVPDSQVEAVVSELLAPGHPGWDNLDSDPDPEFHRFAVEISE